MADPEFPLAGANLIGGANCQTRAHFVKFVCQNERIGTLGRREPGAPPGSATEMVFRVYCIHIKNH